MLITEQASLRIRDLHAYYGTRLAIADISLDVAPRSITAFMGPSGCGKTTLLRCLNRIHELTPGARIAGSIELDGEDIYGAGFAKVELRHRVGMVFQRPNPFPTLSVLGNLTVGLDRRMPDSHKRETAEKALRSAALWNEVKDKLHSSPLELSGGQQQRLCIARALAVGPEILLMDEPTSSLDPLSTSQVEDLLTSLATQYAIIIVTHNMQQAARVSNFAAFMLGDESGVGRLVEIGATSTIFTKPKDLRTEDYITGRFG